VDSLTKKFGDFKAVDGISFKVEEGEIFGFLGPNGAGKSTTMMILTTLLKPTSGRALVGGYDVMSDAKKVREKIGYVQQEISVDEFLTGRENLYLHARINQIPRNLIKSRIDDVLELVELGEKKDQASLTYSGGMRKRLDIANGLLSRPSVLFLDEPTVGLDIQTRRKIWGYIKKIRKDFGMTVFISTHYMEEADNLCDRIGIIDHGKIQVIDTPKSMKSAIGNEIISFNLVDGKANQDAIIDQISKIELIKWLKVHYSIFYNKNISVKELKSERDKNFLLKLKSKISHSEKTINIDGKKINMIQENEISKIDWKKYKVNIVLECTGKFNTKEKSSQHINSGANKVIVSAPCKGAKSIIYGVNEKNLKSSDQVISAASCTTNCLAPVAQTLNEDFGIERGFMTTIHSYTADQRLLDNSHKDLRRARSAPNSIVPTTTGATKSLGDIIPRLKGKIEGISIRVPTPNVSLIEFVFSSSKNLTAEEINNSFIKASKSKLKNILETNNEPLVSSDFNHNPHSAIVDLALTKVIENKMAKVSAWYDNEWGFASRMCDLANYFGKI